MWNLWRVGGLAGVLLGVSMLGELVVFFGWISSTGVKITGNPATSPALFADVFVRGRSTSLYLPAYFMFMEIPIAAAFAMLLPRALDQRLTAGPERVGSAASAYGHAALVVLIVSVLITVAIVAQAGSPTLTHDELQQAIPIIFSILYPALLGAFDLLAAAWVLLVSLTALRLGGLPRLLVYFGFLTSVVLLSGVTGTPGIEDAIAPWLIIVGLVLLLRPQTTARSAEP